MSSAKTIQVEPKAMRKALAHTLKHSKCDCIGVLLGRSTDAGLVVTDAVPLFHDRVFTSALESAFTMITQVYEGQHQIIGIYDAPLRYKSGDAVPLSSLSLAIADQIRQTLQMPESAVVSIRVPARIDDASDNEDSI